MSHEFDIATAVAEQAPGIYTGRLHEGWGVWDTVNGGYLAAVAARAMVAATGRAHPVSLTTHFIRPARPGAVEITTELIASGRRLARAAAAMIQNGETVASFLGSFGEVPYTAHESLRLVLQDLPPRNDCVVPDRSGFENATVAARIETHFKPSDVGFLTGEPSGRSEIKAWLRFADERPVDPLALVFLVDALPPPIFNSGRPPSWVPTIEMTTHVRLRPIAGWLRLHTHSDDGYYGNTDEHCEIYDDSGRTVAVANQLALVRDG